MLGEILLVAYCGRTAEVITSVKCLADFKSRELQLIWRAGLAAFYLQR